MIGFQIKEYLKDPSKFASATGTDSAPVEVKAVEKEAPKPETPEESEDSDLGMGLFD